MANILYGKFGILPTVYDEKDINTGFEAATMVLNGYTAGYSVICPDSEYSIFDYEALKIGDIKKFSAVLNFYMAANGLNSNPVSSLFAIYTTVGKTPMSSQILYGSYYFWQYTIGGGSSNKGVGYKVIEPTYKYDNTSWTTVYSSNSYSGWDAGSCQLIFSVEIYRASEYIYKMYFDVYSSVNSNSINNNAPLTLTMQDLEDLRFKLAYEYSDANGTTRTHYIYLGEVTF